MSSQFSGSRRFPRISRFVVCSYFSIVLREVLAEIEMSVAVVRQRHRPTYLATNKNRQTVEEKVKVKAKFTLEQSTKAQGSS